MRDGVPRDRKVHYARVPMRNVRKHAQVTLFSALALAFVLPSKGCLKKKQPDSLGGDQHVRKSNHACDDLPSFDWFTIGNKRFELLLRIKR